MATPEDEKELERAFSTEQGEEAAVAYRSEPLASPPLQYVGTKKEFEVLESEKNENGLVRRITTGASSESADNEDIKSEKAGRPRKKWYKRLNPLKYRSKPPVPKERAVSREYEANFLSLLTFQWMAPIMTVCGHPFLPDYVQFGADILYRNALHAQGAFHVFSIHFISPGSLHVALHAFMSSRCTSY